MTVETAYQQAIDAGLEVASYNSDLYIRHGSERAAEIVADCRNVTVFTADDGSGVWYEVPFAFTPFWERSTRLYK